MGLRFRKSIKLAPGVKLNLGMKSAGISLGGKYGGVSFNTKSGARARVSAPGTGLSYTTKLGGSSSSGSKKADSGSSRGSGSCLIVCLKALGILMLIPLVMLFGWIGGIVWFAFYRKKLDDDPDKQNKMSILVATGSVLSLIIMIASFTNTPSASGDTSVIATESETMAEEDMEEIDSNIDVMNKFIELYNTNAETQITDLVDIDIHDKSGGYYRTEFRTSAYSDAVAKHGSLGERASADLVQYSDGFRIYVLADSFEELQKILETTINIYDSSVTHDIIQSEIYDKIDSIGSGVSFYVNDISGYYEILNRETGSCSVMLDNSSISFIE